MKTITAQTLIPIGAIGVVVGATMWLTTIFRQGEANAQQLSDFKAQVQLKDERVYHEFEKINDKLDQLLAGKKN